MIDNLQSDICSKKYSDMEKTSYQIVTMGSNYTVDAVRCGINGKVLDAVTYLFRKRLLPKNERIGTLVLFFLPDRLHIPFQQECGDETICNNEAKVRFWLNKYSKEGQVRIDGGGISSLIPEVNTLLQSLSDESALTISFNNNEGELHFIPLSRNLGFLSDHFIDDKILVNSHFFLLEFSDLETKFDIIGEPFGLLLINGEIINPPVYSRESLFIDEGGHSECHRIGIRNIPVKINDDIFEDSVNAVFYVRPEAAITPKQEGTDIAIVGRRIVGYRNGGEMEIPEAGFVVHLNKKYVPETVDVDFINNTEYVFGIQVGPLLVGSESAAVDFNDSYYSGKGTTYPPTVFPSDWDRGKAARMGFGVKGDKTVLIWVEGSKPEIYKAGTDSLGFSLAEFSQLAADLGIENFINLDGGGSSQMALGSLRTLRIADRNEGDGEDFERPVPLGLSFGSS